MEFIERKILCVEENQIFDLDDSDKMWLIKSYPLFYSDFYCKMNEIIYHRKNIDIELAINELLGKLISEYFGDEQNKSLIIKQKVDNIYYLLTENFIKKGKKYTELNAGIFPKIKLDDEEQIYLNDLEYLNRIKWGIFTLNTNKKDLVKLQYKLKMMIVNDFIRNHSDRWHYNFMIEYSKNHCKLMPLYDFEYSFLQYDEDLLNCFNFDITDKTTIDYIQNDEQFQEIINLALKINVKQIFEKLFDEYPVRMNKEEIGKYKSIVERKKQDIKRYKLIK